jgi:hypothetical protein
VTVLAAWLALSVLVLVLVVVVTALVRSERPGAPQSLSPRELAGASTIDRGTPIHPVQVESLRDRLGHDIRTLEPGTDPVTQQALADASERFTTCSVLLERAESQPELRTAWLAAVEGLTASRLVRVRQGLDPGPEIPLPPALP